MLIQNILIFFNNFDESYIISDPDFFSRGLDPELVVLRLNLINNILLIIHTEKESDGDFSINFFFDIFLRYNVSKTSEMSISPISI